MRQPNLLKAQDCFVGLRIVTLTVGLFGCVPSATAVEVKDELGPAIDVGFVAKVDGTEQRYVIQRPKGFQADKPYSLLIALHGHGSDRWQFVNNERDECRAARDAAAKYQMLYVSPDYRAKTSWLGPAAEADLLQIIDDLHQQFRIDKIVVCGGSMGGTSALAFATLHPEIVDGVVSLNGTSNLLEYEGFSREIAESFGGSKVDVPDVYRARSAELFPDRLVMPMALTTGGRDTVVPSDSTLRLSALLKQRGTPLNQIHRPEGGHETSYQDATQAMQFVLDRTVSNQRSTTPIAFKDGPIKIVCLGDSVTGVYYHTGGRRAYPEMVELGLRKLLGRNDISVVNAGISGQTTQDGLNRLDKDVLAHHPQLVTISFGLNDMTRIPLETYRTNLEQLTKRCRDAGSEVILCTPNSVIDTAGRPIEKLVTYCEMIRTVGRELSVPVCDQFRSGNLLKSRAPWTWRLNLSDEIHPNMAGHKRMAEELCKVISGQAISLDREGPPRPSLPHLRSSLQGDRPIRVLAMTPYDDLIAPVIKQMSKAGLVEVTSWSVEGKSIATLEQESKSLARTLKPDLVVLAIPRIAAAKPDEEFVRNFSWVMNWSLSFGLQEWDCVVVHPSVASPDSKGATDERYRQLVHAQDLDLIDRFSNDPASPAELIKTWFKSAIDEN